MTWFDLLICVIAFIAFLRGYMSGLVMQLASLAGIIAGAMFAGKIADLLSPYLLKLTSAEAYIIKPLSYIVAFLLILIVFIFAGRIIHSVLKAVKINFLNRIAGSAFAFAKWIILTSIILNLLITLDKNQKIIKQDVKEKSFTYPYIRQIATYFIPFLKFDNIREN